MAKFNCRDWYNFATPVCDLSQFYFFLIHFCGILKVTDLIANMVFYIVHIFGKHGLHIFHFLSQNGTLLLSQEAKGNDMAHLENILALNLGIFFKNMTPGRKTKMAIR